MKNIFVLFFILSTFTIHLSAKEIVTENATVQLVANSESDFNKGQIAVHYKLRPLWHIYWLNPGDSGAAPKFQIDGASIAPIAWPMPKRIPVSHLVNFGYEDEVLIFLDLPSSFAGKSLDLEWLVCKVDCVPGFGSIALEQKNVRIDSTLFQKFKDRVPQKIKQKGLLHQETPDFIDIVVPGLSINLSLIHI